MTEFTEKVYVEEFIFIKIKPGEHSMDFEICEHPNGNTDEEDELVSGFLKWDGCMNWKTGDIMYHFCDPEDADRLATFFKKLYELGSEHISHWSY